MLDSVQDAFEMLPEEQMENMEMWSLTECHPTWLAGKISREPGY